MQLQRRVLGHPARCGAAPAAYRCRALNVRQDVGTAAEHSTAGGPHPGPGAPTPSTASSLLVAGALAALVCGELLAPGTASALDIHPEPANALSLPTWAIQWAALTVIGNCTCWWAAYRIYEGAMAESKGSA
ncbi:hypothetical protein TSOC_009619 [Tetrabaena socialis]|uniref:Uncharacterized protein n=1 Tax=Tetrabaena socialis TaxID=47790 RepID=A0A2J7ZVG7_9CHLO|nr:hypothetical protein TSOC_009619 [Tetrabaena socialis]|eukprot:PNH04249.1 hypothetical protein TSOC_009619 [Tetrabaena socialis]